MNIIWAFNPFDQNKKFLRAGQRLIKSLFSSSDQVRALFIATGAELSLATALDLKKMDAFYRIPKKKIEEQLKGRGLSRLKVEVVARPEIVSQGAAAKIFVEQADKLNCDLIMLATHGRKGFSRWILGSFAELLIHRSHCDLLAFHEKLPNLAVGKLRMLYCHDFSPKGERGLKKALFYAKKWKAHLTLFHVPLVSYEIHLEIQESSVASYRDHFDKRIKRLESALKAEGVSGEVVVAKGWEAPSDAIVTQCGRQKPDLVLMTAQKGRLASLIGGSVTRKILRNTDIPTLVLKV